MSVGVPTLDADHKTLVGLINDLHRSIGDEEEYATLGSVLQALTEYAEYHFAREERVMAAYRYPSLGAHTVMHHKLAQQVRDLKARYDADRDTVRAKECLDFLHKWLIEHICSADMDYRAWVLADPSGIATTEGVTITGAKPREGGIDWKALRVLVVDDNANFCQVMRTILGGIGVADVRTAEGVAKAETELAATPPDVVITDWHVGKDSGLDLVRWIRRHPVISGLPVLVLSGHERVANRDLALAAGADEFMEKPISARGLLICVARLLARRRDGRND